MVLDTNVLIAAMRSTTGASHAILLAIHRREIVPVISVPLVMEYEEVCKRPGLIPHLTSAQIDIVLNQICSRAEEQRVFFRWRPFLPDPDDDMLVELAIAANVSYLVTGNLRDLAPARALGIQVMEPREFVRLIQTP
ncbi:MAG: putative toxin-antitoxin system toxin component, PIN family [Verrucomicrobiae bacterium]|nr:putative toxin-antitoxin system toxin component, PIN family [Verrucomicrobiae bacterium]